MTRIGTFCPALSFTHLHVPGTLTLPVASLRKAIGGGTPGASVTAKMGIGHVFSSAFATAEPSERNHDCLRSSLPALMPTTSTSGKPICFVHWPISSSIGWPELFAHAAHRSFVVALPYLNVAMYSRSPSLKAASPTTAWIIRMTEPPLQYEIASKTCSTSLASPIGTWIGCDDRSASSLSARPCMSMMNCSHIFHSG